MSTGGKLWELLNGAERRAAAMLIAIMLVGVVFETLGVGLVVPAVTLMTQADLGAKYPVIAPVLHRLGNPSRTQLVVGGLFLLALVTAIKAVVLAFLVSRQSRFAYGLQADVSQRLFEGYLRQPYLFHLQHNSAQLIRNTINQAAELAGAVYQGVILVTEVLVLIGISVLLLVVEPVGAVAVVSLLGLASWGFYRATRARAVQWGAARQFHDGLRIQHLQQGLGGAKDIKVLGRDADFHAQFRTHSLGSAKSSEKQNTLLGLPRLWLELLAVTGLAVLVLVMVMQGKPIEAILPSLGLFAAAAFRATPSMNRLLTAVQTVRFSLPVVNSLHEEVRQLESVARPHRGEPLPFTSILAVDHLTFHYPNTEVPALSDVSLVIHRGSSVGIIGGSGAGKSSLVDVMLGLLVPRSGRVTVDGVDISKNLRGWQDQVGYVPQTIFLTDDSLRRNVAFGVAEKDIDEAAVLRAIGAAQLDEFVSELPEGLATRVGERGVRLSGGQRQRIGIARALYHDPSVLILDEATSSLDTATERGVMESVRALHGTKTIVIIAHRLSTVEHCERLFRLDHGRLVDQGDSAVILSRAHASG